MSLRDYISKLKPHRRRGGPQHCCDALCDQAIQGYQEEHLSLVQLSRKLGIGIGTIRLRLRAHITLRPQGGPRGMWKDHALALWNEKHTLQRIGETIGVSRERIRQVLQASGINTSGRRRCGHRCNDACAVALTAIPPISVTRLARQANITWGRLHRAVQIHSIPTGRDGHVCTERCNTIRDLLATGTSIRQTARTIGIAESAISQRYATYHPDWNWERKRTLPATALMVNTFHGSARKPRKEKA